MLDIDSRVEIGVRAEATDHAAKRLLVRSVGFVWIMTHATFLRGIGALDYGCGYASLGSVPGDLPRTVVEPQEHVIAKNWELGK